MSLVTLIFIADVALALTLLLVTLLLVTLLLVHSSPWEPSCSAAASCSWDLVSSLQELAVCLPAARKRTVAPGQNTD